MAFTVTTAISTEVDATSHDVPLPSGSGGWLVVFIVVNDIPTVSGLPWGIASPASELASTTNASKTLVLLKNADGSEAASTFTTDSIQDSVTRVFRVTGSHASTPPELSSAQAAASTTPSTPSLTPSWGAEENLWISAIGHHNAASVYSSAPPNYTDLTEDDSGNATVGSQTSLATARRILNAATEDPGNFAVDVGRTSVLVTLAVRPEAAGPPDPGPEADRIVVPRRMLVRM